MSLDMSAGQIGLHRASRKVSEPLKNNAAFRSADFDSLGIWKNTTFSSIPITKDSTLPSRGIFKDFYNDQVEGSSVPSPAECASHLEFLAAVRVLRQRVIESEKLDKVFGTTPNKKTVVRKGVSVTIKDDTQWERRQSKWDKFLDMAVARFMTWWTALPKTYSGQADGTEGSEDLLPPLDVLIVWHSFLLNPRWFRQQCGDGKKLLYQMNFPWKQIHFALNSNDNSFSLSPNAQNAFETATSLGSNLEKTLLSALSSTTISPPAPAPTTRHTPIFSFALSPSPTTASLDSLFPDEFRAQHFVGGQIAEGLCSDVSQKLKAAVLRQQSFVDKMWDKYWLGSPALTGTIDRAIDRYAKFLELYKQYPTTMFVPTLDIDLVWHTHQCSPRTYYKVTREVARKFVNHDDSIVEDKLHDGMKETKRLWGKAFDSEYLICGCWDCEALLTEMENAGSEKPDWTAIAKKVSAEVAAMRSVEISRRKRHAINTVR